MIRQAYDNWAEQYDTNVNKTRDMEARVLRTTLAAISFKNCLEIGCGTGKNSEWLVQKAEHLTAVDFSTAMLEKAKEKIRDPRVEFVQADITAGWGFRNRQYDLVAFSLVLEHVARLDPVFRETAAALEPGGYVYIGELHPFKQYAGSKARFDTGNGQQVVDCFTHPISDFTGAAKNHGLTIADISEFFDEDNRNEMPRILAMLLQKPGGFEDLKM